MLIASRRSGKTEIVLLFYYPRSNRYGLNALAAAVESHPELTDLPIVFARTPEDLFSQLISLRDRACHLLVGFSFFTTQIWDIAELLRKLSPFKTENVLLIAGGPHATGDPAGTLQMGFDLVVRGEGEETLCEILLSLKSRGDFHNVRGIAFPNENGEWVETGRRPTINLDDYPPVSLRYYKFGPIEITRGCPFACAYCQTSHLFGGRPRHRSVAAIGAAVEIMKKENLCNFRAVSPDAFAYGSPDGIQLNLQQLQDLLENLNRILKPEGKIYFGTFPSEVRPEHVTPETLRLLREYADNDNLVIGAQSGSQRVLDRCRRRHTVEDVLRAVELTRAAGLKANVDFILGLPGETEDDVEATIGVMEQLVRMGARIHAHTFMPLPQTGFARARPKSRAAVEIGKRISRLFPDGAVYGEWLRQARQAGRMADYLARSRRITRPGSKVRVCGTP